MRSGEIAANLRARRTCVEYTRERATLVRLRGSGFRGDLCGGYRLPGALDKTPSVTERGEGKEREGWHLVFRMNTISRCLSRTRARKD